MDKPLSKTEIRASLEQEVQRFLRDGGLVKQIPRGQSGRNPGEAPVFLSRSLFTEPPVPRTQIPEVVAAIEERRKAMLKRTPERKRRRQAQPRRKTIYDDFGEPLRKVWVEE